MAVQNQRLPKDNITSAASAQLQSQPPSSATVTASALASSASTPASAAAVLNSSSSSFAVASPSNLSTTKAFQAPSMATSTPAHHPLNTVTSTAANVNGGGPRVSFNRDVHVKRIGKRSNDLTNYELANLQPPQQHIPPSYHQLPADLSAESIQKEAALVLAQAKRHKSTAENGDNIPTFKVKTKRSGGGDSNPQKFNSLPLRKKKPPVKPVSRSSSDAAAKKPPKRPSIFSIFSRKSDTSINQVDRDPRFEDSGGRRLVRSKSDVGSSSYKLKKVLKDSKSSPQTQGSSSKSHLPTQLSPIIENDSKEDCFEEQFSRERRKSEAITDREKHESAIGELLARSRSQAEVDGSLVARTPVSEGIKEKILTLQAKSQENMHSSQLPAQKLPLTKGHTVNGMVKRLSMERFSPPPTIMGPAFSYIRPNEGITYAQLELQEDNPQRTVINTLPRREYHNRSPIREYTRSPIREREYTRSPVREYRSPVREFRSNSRDIFTPERELLSTTTTTTVHQRKSEDKPDYMASQRNNYSPNYNTNNGTTTIHIGGSFSPSPWQQLSPRNLSDEDEGLGLETRKYYDEELQQHKRSKSPAEPPIVPKIRSITPPRENGYNTRERERERYHTPSREVNLNDDMGYRRARLESRILTRRFGESATAERNGYQPSRENSHERVLETARESPSYQHSRYLSPEREIVRDGYEPRFHKPEAKEIINKYSPERSHLDIIAPASTNINITSSGTNPTQGTMEKTSRYKHTKYYDDGHGGVKEVYERETQFDTEGKPHVRESRHRERLDSYTGKPVRESSPLLERQLMADYEPKSLDSQFTSTDQYRSSPENMKRYDVNSDRVGTTGRQSSEDRWHSSLKRDKLQQRSFDKGDSGIENDFRKESFNGDLVNRWRKRTIADDIKSCESFLKKERRHSEQQQSHQQHHDNYIYRERSIDDGSHYDPHLDKYPMAGSSATLRRRDQQSQTALGHEEARDLTSTSTLKRTKKLGGFEKVKQLFSGGGTSGSGGDKKDPERKSVSSSTSSSAGTQQTIKSKDKDKYMVKEEEMRSRYREHRPNGINVSGGGSSSVSSGGGVGVGTQTREPKAIDISMRRRLSTPKASPLLLKRTSSDNKTRKESPLAKPEKLSWFKSLDRRSKSKSKEKLNATPDTSSLKRTKNSRHNTTQQQPTKNLRFFGDTDLDSNPPTISKANTLQKSRPLASSSSLNRSQKYSQSAYNLDRIRSDSPQRQDYRHNLATGSKSVGAPTGTTTTTTTTTTTQRHRSTSMHNLDNQGNDEVDFRRRRHYSRSRELDHISESGSETEDQQKSRPGLMASRTLSRDRLDRTQRYDDHSYRRSTDRPTSSTPNGGDTSSSTQHQPRRAQPYLMGPPKPARSAERRAMSYSRERDRFPAESSGTEGESSLHSQRSVVYLHATTVGAIPQPYHLRRRSISRDDLSSNKSKNQQNPPLQPMTRTVSRSVSMLAPWKPKLISDGYEINYSQEQNKTMSTLPRKTLQNGKSSTMSRPPKKPEPLSSRHAAARRHTDYLKDDQSSLRNSSTTSASKSGLSTNLHRKPK